MCSHLSEYYAKYGVKSYQLVNSHFSAAATRERRKNKCFSIFCFQCTENNSSKYDNKIFSCAHCVFLACKSHLADHYKSKKHFIGINIEHGMLFCFICSDYVYDSVYLKINEKNHNKMSKSLKNSISFYPWFPSDAELACLKQHPKKVISETNRLGLRGITFNFEVKNNL